MEARGYDREAYEHSLEVCGKRTLESAPNREETANVSQSSARATYLFKLEGPLNILEKVESVANLGKTPEALKATGDNGDNGDAVFCCVNREAKQAITNWLSAQNIKFKPTFARISKAEKALSTNSAYPTLGLDSTLPQNRPNDHGTNFYPAQNQYPVWYFSMAR